MLFVDLYIDPDCPDAIVLYASCLIKQPVSEWCGKWCLIVDISSHIRDFDILREIDGRFGFSPFPDLALARFVVEP